MTGQLDRLRGETRSRSWFVLAGGAIAFSCVFIAWAATARLDQFAMAEGEVVPTDQVKVVQHLEGGSIAHIYVTDGQLVEEGDELVAVELALTGTNREELQARLDGLALARARLIAESKGAEPLLPDDIAKRRPDLAAAEISAFQARKTELQNRIESAQQRVRQQEMAVNEMVTTSEATATDLGMAEQNLAMSADLLRDGLTSKMDHLLRERETKMLEGKFRTLKSSIPKARAALEEARHNLSDEVLKFQRSTLEELGRVEQDIAGTQELLTQADTQAMRKTIRSPVRGIVKNLRYHTIGGVIGPGDPILEIVPANDNVVIEARLRPEDSGIVTVGQPVRLKISAYDYVRFGTISGVLTYVSADSLTDKNGVPYFQVKITPDQVYLGKKPGQFPIRPGMTAVADINTGTHTVLEYLMKPVIRLQYDSLHER